MGASTWVYFTPYHPKPAVALRRLRQEVFTSGQYRRPPSGKEQIEQARSLPPAAKIHRVTAASMREAAESVRRNPEAFETTLARQQLLAFYRNAGRTPPPGTPAEQMIAFYEGEADRSERMAEEAEAVWPKCLRFLDAVEADSADGLPANEQRDFALFKQIDALSPPSKKFGRPETPAGTIEELLDQAGVDGTHSILDITRVGRRATYASAFPLRDEFLVREFGTTQPTREQVEGSELTFAEGLTWSAVYFAVYRDGEPAEWVFVGSSGD